MGTIIFPNEKFRDLSDVYRTIITGSIARFSAFLWTAWLSHQRRFLIVENKPKKLTLNQETLRNLTQEESAMVVGGATTRICTVTCPVVSFCQICN